jgi:CBS domain-containing protein
MEKEAVGALVVLEEGRPSGVLTDRDIVRHAVAGRHDPDTMQVREAQGRPAVVIAADARLSDATALMSRHRLRRLPVVNAEGAALGLISGDDIVRLLADEISGLAHVAATQLPVGVDVGTPAEATEAERPRETRPVEHYRRDVRSLRADTSVRSLADAMKAEAVGCVVITGDVDEAVGVVTDRDIALRVVAAGRDPDATPASAIMSSPLVAADATQPLEEVVEKMRSSGVRRIPVLSDGRPVGIVTYSDLLIAFSRELAQLGEAIRRERMHEQVLAVAPRDVLHRLHELL